MNDLEKEVVREKKYEENRRRMNIVKRNLMISRIYNIYVNLAVTLISAASMYIWISYTNAGIKMVHILAEEVGTISFPWFGATFFIAPILLILSFVSDVFLIRKLSRISQIVYILLCIFTVLEIFLRFEPMKPSHIFILLVYSVLGFWSEDFAIRSYKEMDLLKDEEGYPEFNYLLEKDKNSKYVKYREKWLRKQKKLDYYGKEERPLQNYSVTEAPSANNMDSIGVENSDCDKWFDDSSRIAESAEKPQIDISEIEADKSALPDESEYVIDDPRKRPL